MADFWCLAQGKAIGTFDKSEADTNAKIAMKRVPTVVTGTCGVDAHVIGTKIISRALKEEGFNVVSARCPNPGGGIY